MKPSTILLLGMSKIPQPYKYRYSEVLFTYAFAGRTWDRYYSSQFDNELFSTDLSIFKVLQGFSDPSQPTLPQIDFHRLEQA